MSFLEDDTPRPFWMVSVAALIAAMSAIVLLPLLFAAPLFGIGDLPAEQISWSNYLQKCWFVAAALLALANLAIGMRSVTRPTMARLWFLIVSSLLAVGTFALLFP